MASALNTAQQQQDAMQKEWTALQRRYHAQLITDDADTENTKPSAKRARCFVSLSDPDLSAQFKGETELLFELPAEYPTHEPVFDFRHYKSRLTTQQLEAIDLGMKIRATELRGTLSLRKLLTWLDNNFYPLLKSSGELQEEDGEAATGVAVEEEVGMTAPAEEAESTEASANAIDATGSPETTAADTSANKKKTKKKKDTSRTICRFFLRQQCKSGDQCKFSHEPKSDKKSNQIVEATLATTEILGPAPTPVKKKASVPKPKKMTQDKIDSPADVEKASKPKPAKQSDKVSNPAPVEKAAKPKNAKKQKACKFFTHNKCRDGEKCKFLHETKLTTTTAASGEPTEEPKKKGIIIKVMKAPPPTASSTSEDLERVITSPTAAANSANQAIASEDWSETQQKALDKALKKYPATFDKKIRWLSIASEVDGKSLNECIDRFKYLCKVIRDEQPPGYTPASSPEQEEDDSAIDKRIISTDTRVAIQTEPEEKGAQIRLEELFLHQIGTLIPHRLVCQVQCANCPLKFDANLALDKPSLQKWCPRCSVLHEVHMRPVFAHAASSILAYVDTNENCSVVDVVPSDLLATCLECGSEVLFPSVSPTRRAEHGCFSCHTKLALQTKRYIVGQFTLANPKTKSSSPSSPAQDKKSAQKKLVENFVLGQQLPNKGICEHYRHSFRWFRFQCCGKVFPCDVCHDSSDCAQANLGKIASRMICGLCSKEQSSAVKQCACGNEVGRKKILTSHWEGGAGCRDTSKMSVTDKKKFRGLNKTESKKHSRVGANAKKTPTTNRNNPAE